MNNGAVKQTRRRAGRRDFGTIHADGSSTSPSFSALWYEAGRRRRQRGFASRTDAAAFLARLRTALADGTCEAVVVASDVTVGAAIAAYGHHLAEKGNKPGPMADTLYRLRAFFTEHDERLSALTSVRCSAYYEALRTRVTRTGKPYAVDSHRNMLAEARSLLKWCVTARRWLPKNPLEGTEGKGKRRHGKPQLRIDEARKWMAKAVELADAGEAGAVAAMVALLLGMRASEIVSRVVRDLDDEGRMLWIPDSKTEAGKRTLRVPEVLRPYLQALAEAKGPGRLLFGEHWRDWPREWVQRICKAAGVPVVSAHSMRGLHSTLAMEAGVTGAVVASSLGHESVSTTITSYAKADAVSAAQQGRTLAVLEGGRSSREAS